MTTELKNIAQELREGGYRITRDALTSRTRETRLFLESYGRLIGEFGMWVESQGEAGILPALDIVRLAEFPLDIARAYPHEQD